MEKREGRSGILGCGSISTMGIIDTPPPPPPVEIPLAL